MFCVPSVTPTMFTWTVNLELLATQGIISTAGDEEKKTDEINCYRYEISNTQKHKKAWRQMKSIESKIQ